MEFDFNFPCNFYCVQHCYLCNFKNQYTYQQYLAHKLFTNSASRAEGVAAYFHGVAETELHSFADLTEPRGSEQALYHATTHLLLVRSTIRFLVCFFLSYRFLMLHTHAMYAVLVKYSCLQKK
jgi:hypothetical protein